MDDSTDYVKIIDRIENTRKVNNNYWMELLRIAFCYDSERTKKILKKIIEKDEEVIKSFKELVK